MFENYLATKTDLQTVEDALAFVWKPELDFIFKDKSQIENTLVVSFDSKNIYFWIRESGNYKLEIVNHRIKIEDDSYCGWGAYLMISDFKKYLPEQWKNTNRFEMPRISGSLVTPFTKYPRSLPHDPYITLSSYLDTIVHEFGHVYFDSFENNCYYFRDQKHNINSIEVARNLFNRGKTVLPDIYFPKYRNITEVFAYCTEYSAAKIFWPDHLKNMEKSNLERTKKMLKLESELDYLKQDTTLKDPHDMAMVLGRIIIEKYGNGWVDYLLRSN